MLGSTWQGKRGQGAEEDELEVVLTLDPKLGTSCPSLILLVPADPKGIGGSTVALRLLMDCTTS